MEAKLELREDTPSCPPLGVPPPMPSLASLAICSADTTRGAAAAAAEEEEEVEEPPRGGKGGGCRVSRGSLVGLICSTLSSRLSRKPAVSGGGGRSVAAAALKEALAEAGSREAGKDQAVGKAMAVEELLLLVVVMEAEAEAEAEKEKTALGAFSVFSGPAEVVRGAAAEGF